MVLAFRFCLELRSADFLLGPFLQYVVVLLDERSHEKPVNMGISFWVLESYSVDAAELRFIYGKMDWLGT